MTDVAKCSGVSNQWGTCPRRDACVRYTSTPSEMQAYMETPFEYDDEDGSMVCGWFWQNRAVPTSRDPSPEQVIAQLKERIVDLRGQNAKLRDMNDRLIMDLGLREAGYIRKGEEREDRE